MAGNNNKTFRGVPGSPGRGAGRGPRESINFRQINRTRVPKKRGKKRGISRTALLGNGRPESEEAQGGPRGLGRGRAPERDPISESSRFFAEAPPSGGADGEKPKKEERTVELEAPMLGEEKIRDAGAPEKVEIEGLTNQETEPGASMDEIKAMSSVPAPADEETSSAGDEPVSNEEMDRLFDGITADGGEAGADEEDDIGDPDLDVGDGLPSDEIFNSWRESTGWDMPSVELPGEEGSAGEGETEEDIGTAETAVAENPLDNGEETGAGEENENVDPFANTQSSDPPPAAGDSEPQPETIGEGGSVEIGFEEYAGGDDLGTTQIRGAGELSGTLSIERLSDPAMEGVDITAIRSGKRAVGETGVPKAEDAGKKEEVSPGLAGKFEKYGDVYYAIERAYIGTLTGKPPEKEVPLKTRLDKAIKSLEVFGTVEDSANIMRLRSFRRAFFGNPDKRKDAIYDIGDYDKWLETEKKSLKGAAEAFVGVGISPGELERKGTLNAIRWNLEQAPDTKHAKVKRRIVEGIEAYGDARDENYKNAADVMEANNEQRKAETFFEMVKGVASKEVLGRLKTAERKMVENALKADRSRGELAEEAGKIKELTRERNTEKKERERKEAAREKRNKRARTIAAALALVGASAFAIRMYMGKIGFGTDTSGNSRKDNGAEVAKDEPAPKIPARLREKKAAKAPMKKEVPSGGEPPKPKEPTASGEEGAKVAASPASEAESAEAAEAEPEMSPRDRLVAEIDGRCFNRQKGDELPVSPKMLREAYGSILGKLNGKTLPSDFEAWGTKMINTRFPNRMYELAVMVDILSEWQYEDMRAPWVVYAAGMKAAAILGRGAGRPVFWGELSGLIEEKKITDPTEGRKLSKWGRIASLGDVDAKRCAAAVMAVKVEQIFMSIEKRAHEQMSAKEFKARVKGVFKREYASAKKSFEKFMGEAKQRANRGMCNNVDESKPLSKVLRIIKKKVPKLIRVKKYLKQKRKEEKDLLNNSVPGKRYIRPKAIKFKKLDKGNPYDSNSTSRKKGGLSSNPFAMNDGEFQRPGGSFRMGVKKVPPAKVPMVKGSNGARQSIRMG
jgi:hypothetical protein